MSSRPAPAPEFKLHNNDGIPFPPVEALFAEGDRFFDRFRALTPRGEKDSVIGEGGTGLIHLVRDELMDRIVALKLPHDLILRDKSARADVIRETRQAIELTHPNIVRIHDFHEGPEGWGISMQYVRGRNLDEWRHEGELASRHAITPYPVERIEGWVRQLLEALSYAHEDAHMVHRDIKPKNLMLERHPDGREKLLLTDFGITQKLRLHTMLLSRTQPSQTEQNTMGTLPYMPWEQIQGGPPSVLDDVYAVGATIYELVTGRPPFYEGGYEQIRTQVESVVPPSMAGRLAQFDLPNHGIPRDWEETVAACLAKRPEDRPQSAREIAERLGLVEAPVASADPAQTAHLEAEVERLRGELHSARSRMEELESSLALERAGRTDSSEVTQQLEATLAELGQRLGQAEAEASRWKESYERFESELGGEHEQVVRNLKRAIADKESALNEARKEGQGLESRIGSLEKELADAARRSTHLQKEIEALHQQAREQEQVEARRIAEADQAARAEMAEAVKKARDEADAVARKARKDENEKNKLATEHGKALKRLKQAEDRASKQVTPLLAVLIASLLLGATVGGGWGLVADGGNPAAGIASLESFKGKGKSIPTEPAKAGALVNAGLFKTFLLANGLSEEEHGRLVPGVGELAPDDPVEGVSWWIAEHFCAWLTSQALAKDQITRGFHYTIPRSTEIGNRRDPDPPEWVADEVPDDSRSAFAKSVMLGNGKKDWQIPSLGGTQGAAARGISFRLILRAPATHSSGDGSR